MRRHSTLIALVGIFTTATLLPAQVPGSAPPATVAAATQAAPAAAGAADVGFFGKCFQACEDCKRKLCAMPLGNMLNSMTQPMSAMSGGIIPNFCPTTPTAEDLAKPGVEGASAQAKKDAAEAKARRASVRYLGTLDCRYYPEAEGALIAALRTDGVECVRFEAALVLGKGCCCSKKVIEALTHAVSCSEKDGNPAERSDRVRFAACLALERCLACYSEPVEPKEDDGKAKEKSTTPKEPGKVEGGQKTSSRAPDKNTYVAARLAIKNLHARYGISSSQQINVTPQETVKLVPVPSNSPVVNNQVVVVNTPVTMTPVAPVAPVAQPRREPKSLFSVLKNAMGGSEQTTVVEQPAFQHPMQQYQQPAQVVVAPPPSMPVVQRQATPLPSNMVTTPMPASFVPKLPTENSTPASFVIFDEMKSPRK